MKLILPLDIVGHIGELGVKKVLLVNGFDTTCEIHCYTDMSKFEISYEQEVI